MKQGLSIQDLARELERQRQTKKDFVSDTRELTFHSGPSSFLNVGSFEPVKVSENFHRQLGERLQIPAKYYDRLRKDFPNLLDENVNYLFKNAPERRLVRTLDGTARAFLSDRYRVLDNEVVAEAALPILSTLPDLDVLSANISAEKFYLKVVNKRLIQEVKKGDVVQAGIVISNSEVGLGAFKVEPLLFRLICLNGAIVNSLANSSYHVGKRAAEQDGAYELYRDETLRVDDRAFVLKVQDLVKAAVSDVNGFNIIVGKWKEATEKRLEGNPVKAVEILSDKFQLTEFEQSGVLRHLINGGDLSAYGLLNAVTRTSQDVGDYDRATELERFGARVIELPNNEWAELAEAA